jgi:hypothetical protein
MPSGPEERPLGQPGLADVLGDGLRRGEVEADPPMLVALLVEGDRRLVAVLVEVLDPEPAAGADPGPAIPKFRAVFYRKSAGYKGLTSISTPNCSH